MIELKKDKSGDTWLLTQTDKEGFHKQMNFTKEELDELCKTWKRNIQ